MSEFEELYGNEFFVIDSNNLNSIKDKTYGFTLESLCNDITSENIEFNHEGSYVSIKTDDKSIFIEQDYNGSYGLYLFKKEDYFAISNSFLKLVEHLKNKYELSLHIPIEDYNIHLIELGYLLKSIYHNPKSFLFIEFLSGQYDYMISDDEDGDNYYVDIINLVKDNLPLFLLKTFLDDEIDNLSNIENGVSYMTNDMNFALLLNFCQYLIDNNIVDYDINFLKQYIGEKKTETLFARIVSDLNGFKQNMDVQLQPIKISEAFIRELDDLYVNAQIIYSAI